LKKNDLTEKLPSAQSYPLILTICAISAVFIFLIYSKNFVFGSELGNWTYSYYKDIHAIPDWIPFTVLGLTAVNIFIGDKLIQKHEKLAIVLCFLIAFAVQASLQRINQFPMDQIIVSDRATSFYSVATQYSPTELLSQYQTLLPNFPPHSRANLPGKILFYQLLTVFSKSPMVMGYIIIAISSLGSPLIYGISKRLFRDRTVALYSAVLYMLIPCKQVFFPSLNTVTPLFILLCLYLLVVYLDTKKIWLLILLGVSLYFMTLFEPSPLVMGLLFVAVLLNAIGQKKISVRDLAVILFIPTLSFTATYLTFLFVLSFDLIGATQSILKDAITFNSEDKRDYSVWILENAKEFFVGAGLPVMMIFIYFVFSILSQWKTLLKSILKWPMEILYVLSYLLTFCIVLFLGINRGETSRLWIYLAVFFQIPVAYFMAKIIRRNFLFFLLSGMVLLQTMVSLQRVGFIAP
jgi:hypothetical protein